MNRLTLLLCVAFFTQAEPGDHNMELPLKSVSKIRDMPDFCQTDQRYGRLPFSGGVLRGPVAVSNALIWLDTHGFPDIVKADTPTPRDQLFLIRRICSVQYMKTSARTGTYPKQIVAGLEQFLSDRGYGVTVEQMGWRSAAKRIGRIPDSEWLLRSCVGDTNVVLNIGWYIYEPKERIYQRIGGHWVTLAGYDVRPGGPLLYIHDPAPRNGISKRTTSCRLRALPVRATLRLQSGGTNPADGFFELAGIAIKNGADLAVIDGAIAFTVVRDHQEETNDSEPQQ